jgi:hypothetical protein
MRPGLLNLFSGIGGFSQYVTVLKIGLSPIEKWTAKMLRT